MANPIAVANEITLPHPPEDLWPYVANTQRMDRAIGMPEAHFRRVERSEGGEEVTGEYRLFRRLTYARWREHPFSWQKPRHYTVLREYDRGPLRRFVGGAELEPLDDGRATRIRVHAEFIPRNRFYTPFVTRFVAPSAMRRSLRQYEAIGAYLAGRAQRPFIPIMQLPRPVNRHRLDDLIARLCAQDGMPGPPARALGSWLVEAADEDVAGMRPLELANQWHTDERETLEAFLRATVAGVLEMRWELLCPSCRGVKAEAGRLQELAATGYCSACHLPFDANVDEAIEARFYPTTSVRRVEVGTYCVGHPMDTPHRLAQATLPPGASVDWRLHLAPGPFIVRSPQSRGVCRLDAADVERDRALEIRIESTVILPEGADVPAGDLRVRLTNGTAHQMTVVLDDGRWSRTAATPGRLMLVPAFRQLFSAEALSPGVELSIARVGLFFTDLAGSTSLYERAGEARAFRMVGEHFTLLRAVIESHDGVVVKTIGDAVMGAFPDGRAALAAAVDAQQAIRALDTGGLADPARILKVGVHSGPCYAVTLNERLDYFGAAVNLASRAQNEASGGQIVVTSSLLDDAPDLAASLPCRPFDIQLRGLSLPVRLHRIDCAELLSATALPSATAAS